MQYIDEYLNKVTMYKLVAFSLSTLALLSILFGFTGTLDFSGSSLLASLAIFMFVGFAAKYTLEALFKAPGNAESSLITAIILFFIFSPPNSVGDALTLGLICFVAIVTKFIIARNKKHIFNPAAAGAVIVGLVGITQASWWIGNTVIAVFVGLSGMLLLRKLHRFQLFFSFALTAVSLSLLRTVGSSDNLPQLLVDIAVSSPLLFLGMFMLTEPSTLPPQRRLQLLYGAIVGIFYGSAVTIGNVYITPEIALLLGNLVAYCTSKALRQRYELQLAAVTERVPGIYEFDFRSTKPVIFAAGQYIEITVPHSKPDIRGNRRTFTIASAPGEPTLMITTKLGESLSSYKAALLKLPVKTRVYTGHVSGDFILPKRVDRKLVWVAGGVGITPFRSMAQQLVNDGQKRDITLLYYSSDPAQFMYQDVFETAGIKAMYVSKQNSEPLTELITKHVPDYAERLFYVSGPDGMVRRYKHAIRSLKIARSRVITDYFSGY